MDITTKPIIAAVGKGQDDKDEVVGQASFASSTGSLSSAVARVCEVLRQATATMTSGRLWRGCGVPRVCDGCEQDHRATSVTTITTDFQYPTVLDSGRPD